MAKQRLSMKLLWKLNLKYLESKPEAPNIAGFLLFVEEELKATEARKNKDV